MKHRYIDLSTVQLARLLWLVKHVRPVPWEEDRGGWALLVEGRGFSRLLQANIWPPSSTLHALPSYFEPRPETFFSRAHAIAAAEVMGLKRLVVRH